MKLSFGIVFIAILSILLTNQSLAAHATKPHAFSPAQVEIFSNCLASADDWVSNSGDIDLPSPSLGERSLGLYIVDSLESANVATSRAKNLSVETLLKYVDARQIDDTLAQDVAKNLPEQSLARIAQRFDLRTKRGVLHTAVAYRFKSDHTTVHETQVEYGQLPSTLRLFQLALTCRSSPDGLAALAEVIRLKIVPYEGQLERVYRVLLSQSLSEGSMAAAHLLALRQPGYEADKEKPTTSIELLLQSARSGNNMAELDLFAILMSDYIKYAKSNKILLGRLKELREQGYSDASFLLATNYLYGEISNADHDQGLRYLMEAVLLGNELAREHLNYLSSKQSLNQAKGNKN